MIRHLIYIYKIPMSTRRIGFVYSSVRPIHSKDLPDKLTYLLDNFEVAIHRITTHERSFDSIFKKDAFFDNIEFHTDLDGFITTLKEVATPEKKRMISC